MNVDMDSKIDLTLQLPTLRMMCQIKTAITLWTRDRSYFQKCLSNEEWGSHCDEMKKSVILKTSTFHLPDVLMGELKFITTKIGDEIFIALDKHETFLTSNDSNGLHFNREVLYELLDRIQWTVHGTINESAMARSFVQNLRSDVLQRYRMACNFCLEDCIQDLWPQLESIPENMLNENLLCQFWYNQMQTKTGHCDYAGLFDYSFENSLLDAVKYFWEKMSQEERSEKLGYFLFNMVDVEIDLPRFLIQKLSPQKFLDFFTDKGFYTKCSNFIFQILVFWPFRFYMEATKPLLDLLTCECYLNLLLELTWMDYNMDLFSSYPQSPFRFCWEQARPDVKTYLTEWKNFTMIFEKLVINTLKSDDIKLLFNVLNGFDDKELLALSQEGLSLCMALTCERPRFLSPYLKICISNRATALKLLDAMMLEHGIYLTWGIKQKAYLCKAINDLFPLEVL